MAVNAIMCVFTTIVDSYKFTTPFTCFMNVSSSLIITTFIQRRKEVTLLKFGPFQILLNSPGALLQSYMEHRKLTVSVSQNSFFIETFFFFYFHLFSSSPPDFKFRPNKIVCTEDQSLSFLCSL